MKKIKVVAAVICNDFEKIEKIFCTQRGSGEFAGGWEFPGGKIEEGESNKEALEREILEELETKIIVGDLIETVEYDYPSFHLSMDCFLCVIEKGDLTLTEHLDSVWADKEKLNQLDWLPADLDLVEKIKGMME